MALQLAALPQIPPERRLWKLVLSDVGNISSAGAAFSSFIVQHTVRLCEPMQAQVNGIPVIP